MQYVADWAVLPMELSQPQVEAFRTTYARTYYYAVYYRALDNVHKVYYYASNNALSFTFSSTTISYSGGSSVAYMDYNGNMTTGSNSGTITSSAKECRIRKCLIPIESPETINDPLRILYGIGDDLYSTKTGEAIPIGKLPIQEQMLLEHGDTEIKYDLLVEFEQVRIYLYTLEPSHGGFRFTSSHVWKPQTILQKKDFEAPTAKKLTITATVPSSAQLLVMFSTDSGATWGTCDSSGVFTERNLEDIGTVGMNYTTVNSLTAAALTKLVSETHKLRLALYLKQTTHTERITITSIRLDY